MKIKVCIGSCLLLLAWSVCAAQNNASKSKPKVRPDFSGTWVLDKSKSSLDPATKKNVVDYVLTIIHREPEVRMARKYKEGGHEHSEELVYHTDGRPEFITHAGRPGPQVITRWRGDQLVRRSTSAPDGLNNMRPDNMRPGLERSPIEISTKEEWKLSTDGKTLTRTITTSGVVMSRARYVFVRG